MPKLDNSHLEFLNKMRKLQSLLLITFVVLLSACAEIKDTAKTIGHGTKNVTTEIGHASRDTVKAIGKNTKKVVKDITDDDDE